MLKLDKCFAIAILVLSSAGGAAAQQRYTPHTWVGGRVGATVSRQDFSPSVPQGWQPGYSCAVSLRYAEEKTFSLVAELGITTRGWKEDFQESPLRYNRTLTFVSLPVMTQISYVSRRSRLFVNLGPEFGYLINDRISANFDYSRLDGVTQWPERPRMTEQLGMPVSNKFDYGITGGIGAEFLTSPRHSFSLEARYYFGLANIFKSSKADTFGASRSTSVEINLGYYFRTQ